MKKKLILFALVITIALTSVIALAFSPRKNLKPSEYNLGTTYEYAIKNKKPFVALFYADWCTYCVRFMPKYKIINEVYKDKYNFVMINVDDPQYEKVIKDHDLGGFPTMYVIDPSIDNRILINNAIYDDLGKVRVELDRYLRIRAMIK